MGSQREKIIKTSRLEEYFRSEVRSALSHQKIATSPYTEFYLVHLLSQFSHRTAFFSHENNQETPLALLYLESLQADPNEAFRLLKQLGDFSLYVAGFFQDSLNRKLVDLNYYRSMGGNAYHRLHSMSRFNAAGDTFADTFLELADNFMKFVDVLSEIGERSLSSSSQDLLRLYERWLSTGSERIRKKLEHLGISPHHLPKGEMPH